MRVKDSFNSATDSLLHGKMRSSLTMLGIVIGIASVIILMSIGQSAQDYILRSGSGNRLESYLYHSGRDRTMAASSRPPRRRALSSPASSSRMSMRSHANRPLTRWCPWWAARRTRSTATMISRSPIKAQPPISFRSGTLL